VYPSGDSRGLTSAASSARAFSPNIVLKTASHFAWMSKISLWINRFFRMKWFDWAG
jgi:hypothetical protein